MDWSNIKMANLLEVGTVAPDFDGRDQDGNPVSLRQFRGSPVVLYFYPKDDTPGCTIEACGFRDDFEAYEGQGAKVLGVSVDGVESHKKFQRKFELNFTLIADADKKITRVYGALSILGIARRVTYLIDGKGVIRHVYEKVRTREHSREVMAALQALQAPRVSNP